MALGTVPAETAWHVDEAFTRAVLLSLGMAVVVAILARRVQVQADHVDQLLLEQLALLSRR